MAYHFSNKDKLMEYYHSDLFILIKGDKTTEKSNISTKSLKEATETERCHKKKKSFINRGCIRSSCE